MDWGALAQAETGQDLVAIAEAMVAEPAPDFAEVLARSAMAFGAWPVVAQALRDNAAARGDN